MEQKLIIFDCDGVLVDSEPLAAEAYVRIFAKHGLGITTEVINQCIGMKQSDIFQRIEDLTGHAFPIEHQDDIWPETRALFNEALTPVPGIVAFLERLQLPRCVASSSSIERITFSLARTGLLPFFGESIFSSSMVKNGKPAPDLFLFAARQMEVAPSKSVVIEDSPFGVQGAVAAGMFVIGFTGGGHTTAKHSEELVRSGAHKIFSHWDDIGEFLLSN
ncbi:MAG: HAD family hydrolase [Shinella sp.]|nr:HAD family hydrolase [Shinella sp.]